MANTSTTSLATDKAIDGFFTSTEAGNGSAATMLPAASTAAIIFAFFVILFSQFSGNITIKIIVFFIGSLLRSVPCDWQILHTSNEDNVTFAASCGKTQVLDQGQAADVARAVKEPCTSRPNGQGRHGNLLIMPQSFIGGGVMGLTATHFSENTMAEVQDDSLDAARLN